MPQSNIRGLDQAHRDAHKSSGLSLGAVWDSSCCYPLENLAMTTTLNHQRHKA